MHHSQTFVSVMICKPKNFSSQNEQFSSFITFFEPQLSLISFRLYVLNQLTGQNIDLKILDTNPILHFALLRLQLIELIRDCTTSENSDITPALNFCFYSAGSSCPTKSGLFTGFGVYDGASLLSTR